MFQSAQLLPSNVLMLQLVPNIGIEAFGVSVAHMARLMATARDNMLSGME